MSANPPPQRRSHTYDSYLPSNSSSQNQMYAGDESGTAGRSRSSRNAAVPEPEIDPNDPPLPSYQALMASENAGIPLSPTTVSESGNSNRAQLPSVPHSRTPSLEHAPYAPVDYGLPNSAYPASHHGHSNEPPSSQSNRFSGSSLGRRPVSDPNSIDFNQLQITPNTPAVPGVPANPVARHKTAPSHPQQYHPRNQYPKQRSVTGGYPTDMDGTASVYSLDSGMGAYGQGARQGQQYPARQAYGGYAAPVQTDYSNPYYSAANDVLGLPPAAPPSSESSYAASSSTPVPTRQRSVPSLARSNTAATNMSTASSRSMPPVPVMPRVTEQVGASSTRRRGMQAAVDLNKPPYTKQYVDDYRKRMKDDPDPEAQFAFAKYLIEAAKKLGDEIGHSDPKLGRKYRDSLLQESLRNIKKLAEGKVPYPDAQFFLANLYGTGQLGLSVDHERAYYLYMMASKHNHPAATYRSAVCNEIGAGTKKDPGRAVLFYRKAAALGDTAAMYKLGMILLGGLLAQPRNIREAIVWLRRAASQADEDNPHALHELALLHERPNGVGGVLPHDPNMARELFTQAAQLNYPPAQFKLGQCHEFGHLGCPIDPRRSIAWYTRAAEKGDSEAELALSGWYLTGSEGVLKQSDTEAYLWGRKAANKGLAKAEYAVGYYTEIGIGVKQDMDLAKRWYMRAAAQQHKRAMQRLTELNNQKNPKGKGSRPTRHDAQSECVVM
ncbi:enzyme activator [Cryptococcus neoformans Ze90-1]|nr:enzyme activator [Cryptococcus neoformans var. grubii Ze90-1]